MAETMNHRIKNAWNAFKNRDPTEYKNRGSMEYSSSRRPDRIRLNTTNERSIVIAVYNRIALDVAANVIQHVKLDQNGRYSETIHSGLNYCITTEANVDQTGAGFIQDVVMSMFDEGVVAVVAVDKDYASEYSDSFEISSMRTGRVVAWFPKHVRVKLYNDEKGVYEEVILPKSEVAIIENPLYSVMNEPNSTTKRLIRKLAILDSIDEQSGAGKLDLLIQLPYVIKSEARRQEAERRRKDIEVQLSGSKYGIAYTDGTERVTQLNRPAENNLMSQIQYLTSMLYSQLGLTEDVFTGKADEATMLNYSKRTIIPILNAVVDEFKRKFLTREARIEDETIMYFKDAFSLVPVNTIADIADKFTRNEIMSSNEIRSIMGLKPSSDPNADQLRNKNLNQPQPNGTDNPSVEEYEEIEGEYQNE